MKDVWWQKKTGINRSGEKIIIALQSAHVWLRGYVLFPDNNDNFFRKWQKQSFHKTKGVMFLRWCECNWSNLQLGKQRWYSSVPNKRCAIFIVFWQKIMHNFIFYCAIFINFKKSWVRNFYLIALHLLKKGERHMRYCN